MATLLMLLLMVCKVVNGQDAPRIVGIIEEVVKHPGDFAFLNCSVSYPSEESGATAKVLWSRKGDIGASISSNCGIDNNKKINSRDKFEMICKGSPPGIITYALRINVLDSRDYATYMCKIEGIGKEENVTANLTVLTPPKISFSGSDVVSGAFLMEHVSMDCVAEGIPIPRVVWGRADGRPLSPYRTSTESIKISKKSRRTTLSIYNVTKEDHGTYRCTADNNVRPADVMRSKLNVPFPPTVSPVEPSYGTETGENTRIMIWCKVEGNPVPEMTWHVMSPEESQRYADGRLNIDAQFFAGSKAIRTDSKYNIEQKIMTVGTQSTMDSTFYSLTLLTVEAVDMGYYVCSARNSLGRSATAVQLYRVNTFAAEQNVLSSGVSTSMSMSVVVMTLWLSYIHVQ